MKLSVIIPTYKNKEMLLRNLRKNLPFLKDCEIIIVNDFPEESIAKDLQEFPNIILIENEKNLGFAPTINNGVHAATGEFVFLLNNDVVLTDDSYLKAFAHFEKDTNLFAVSFAQKEKDGTIVGKNKIFWQNGFFQHSKADNLDFGINGWAEGGSCIIHREKFIELNGLDPIYAPFYWEDIDLSYRAWKNDYQILFDPEILVEHHHESTIGKYFNKGKIETIAFRNQLFFIWKNIHDSNLKKSHVKVITKSIISFILKGKWSFLRGFVQALWKFNYKKQTFKHSDKEILQKFS